MWELFVNLRRSLFVVHQVQCPQTSLSGDTMGLTPLSDFGLARSIVTGGEGQKIQIYFLPLPLPLLTLGLKDVSLPSVQEGSLLILRTIYHQLRPTGTVSRSSSE